MQLQQTLHRNEFVRILYMDDKPALVEMTCIAWTNDDHQDIGCIILFCAKPLPEQIVTSLKIYEYILLFNPVRAEGTKHVFTFYVISPHWHDTCSWNPPPSKIRTYLLYEADILLASQGRQQPWYIN